MHLRPYIFSLVVLVISLPSISVCGSQNSSAGQPSKQAARPTPPYHKSVRKARPFPTLVPASRFVDRPIVARAYEVAHEIPGVLAQQPCYCNCDKAFGHRSLLDCFASDHTAGCGICIKETFFAFQETNRGKPAPEIRGAIIRGDWQKVDMNKLGH